MVYYALILKQVESEKMGIAAAYDKAMENNKTINELLLLIENNAGIRMEADTHFSGIHSCNGQKYFNVNIESPCWCSREMLALERMAQSGNTITRVEPNGRKRLAIFFNQSELN